MKLEEFFAKQKEFGRLTQDILWYESDNLDIDSLKDFAFDCVDLTKNGRGQNRSIEITVFNPYDERWGSIELPLRVWDMDHDEIMKMVKESTQNKSLRFKYNTLTYLTADDLEKAAKFDFGD